MNLSENSGLFAVAAALSKCQPNSDQWEFLSPCGQVIPRFLRPIGDAWFTPGTEITRSEAYRWLCNLHDPAIGRDTFIGYRGTPGHVYHVTLQLFKQHDPT